MSSRRPDPRCELGGANAAPRCVWMTAGVLSYWLCPRQFDCEDCVLDRILSGREPTLLAHGFSEEGDVALHASSHTSLEHLTVPLRRRRGFWYHPVHVWGRPLGPGRVRLGLDDLAARLLTDCEPWSQPELGTEVATHETIGRTRIDGAVVRVASPLPGRVVARNPVLRSHPMVVTWSPYDAGWLVDLATDVELGSLTGFMSDEAIVSRWFEVELGRLAACGGDEDPATRGVGPTMADGGVSVGTLRQALGDEGYRTALRAFFPFE